jgi:spoIIIJ-associated protein
VVATIDAAAVGSEPPSEGEEGELASRVRGVLERITHGLGLPTRIQLREDEESIVASCSGPDLGLLIGKRGQTIDAIQYLVNAIVFRGQMEDRKPIVVDAAGYRARRRASLDALAVRTAERALASGNSIELEPMTAVERKIVHERLKEYPGVGTTSEGTEPNRFVVVFPES